MRCERPDCTHRLLIAIAGALLLGACTETPPPPVIPAPASSTTTSTNSGAGIQLRTLTVRETAAGAIAAAREIHENQQADALVGAGSPAGAAPESRRDAAARAVISAREVTAQGASPIARGGQMTAAGMAVDHARSAGGEEFATGSDAAIAAERHAGAEALRAIEEARRLITDHK